VLPPEAAGDCGGYGGLAKRGVIVKAEIYVQEMSKVDTVVIDKLERLRLEIQNYRHCRTRRLLGEPVLTYAHRREILQAFLSHER